MVETNELIKQKRLLSPTQCLRGNWNKFEEKTNILCFHGDRSFFFSFSELFRSLIPLTSAWPPAVRSLLQRSHLRHSLCQSFPSDDTFSAANQRQKTEGSGINANIHIKKHLCRLLWIIPPSPSAPLSIVHVCITERPSISYCREEWRPPLLHYLQ